MLCGISLKLTGKTLEQCGIDIVLRSSLLTLNTFRKAFGLLIRCFFFFFRHAFVSFQQTFTCTKATETLEKQRYQNNVNVFVLVSLSLPFFNIFYTFFSVSIVGFQQVRVCWIGTFFCTGITKCINSLCKTIEL